MPALLPTEETRLWRPKPLPGVELLRARFVRQHFARHFHRRYALGVIEQGAMAFRYMGRELVADAGRVNLVVPGEAHDGHAATGSGWTYRMFYLEPLWLSRAASELTGRVSAYLPHFCAGVLDDPVLAASIRQLHLRLDTGGISALEAQTRLYGLLARWVSRHADQNVAPREPGKESDAVRTARLFLERRMDEDVSLEELASATNLSPFHLARVFCRSMGLPPHAYLTQMRINRARQLLSGPQPLADIAVSVGFADQSHLNRHFKRIVGVTPGRYRKIVQDR
ncbi:MAG: AraC family transcriptional regulator [Desulfovibrionaceae bacterium]